MAKPEPQQERQAVQKQRQIATPATENGLSYWAAGASPGPHSRRPWAASAARRGGPWERSSARPAARADPSVAGRTPPARERPRTPAARSCRWGSRHAAQAAAGDREPAPAAAAAAAAAAAVHSAEGAALAGRGAAARSAAAAEDAARQAAAAAEDAARQAAAVAAAAAGALVTGG